MNNAERTMRILKIGFIVSVLAFLYIAIRIPSKQIHPPNQTLELVISALALINIGLGFAARPFLMRMAKINNARTGNGSALNQWFTANICSLAMMESCALFALVLHMLGSPTRIVGILFGAALLAMLVWNAGAPAGPADASGIAHS